MTRLTSLIGSHPWDVARNAGCLIRRTDWSAADGWIYWVGGAWMHIANDGTGLAVSKTFGALSGDSVGAHGGHIPGSPVEISADDLLALWTSDPYEGIPVPDPIFPPEPPLPPVDPPSDPRPDPIPMPPPPLPVDPPPGGGGGVGGGGDGGGIIPAPPPPSTGIAWPGVTISAEAFEECLLSTDAKMHLTGSVTIETTADTVVGGRAYKIMWVTIPEIKKSFSMRPGDTRDFIATIKPVSPGSGSITLTAILHIPHAGTPDVTASCTFSVPLVCNTCRWYGEPSTGCFDSIVLGSNRGFDGSFMLTRGIVTKITGGGAGAPGIHLGEDWTGYRYYPGGDYMALSFGDPTDPRHQ